MSELLQGKTLKQAMEEIWNTGPVGRPKESSGKRLAAKLKKMKVYNVSVKPVFIKHGDSDQFSVLGIDQADARESAIKSYKVKHNDIPYNDTGYDIAWQIFFDSSKKIKVDV